MDLQEDPRVLTGFMLYTIIHVLVLLAVLYIWKYFEYDCPSSKQHTD